MVDCYRGIEDKRLKDKKSDYKFFEGEKYKRAPILDALLIESRISLLQ